MKVNRKPGLKKISLAVVFLCLFSFYLPGHSQPLAEEVSFLESVCLSGITIDKDSSSAVIDGEIVAEGAIYNGIEVLSIDKSGVTLRYEGRVYAKVVGDGCLAQNKAYNSTVTSSEKFVSDKSVWLARLSNLADKSELNLPPKILGLIERFFLVFVLLGIGRYIFSSLTLQRIAIRTKTSFSWFAWIWVPIPLSLILLCGAAKKSRWLTFLFFLPVVNIILYVYLWCEICRLLKKPAWFGVFTLFPLLALYLRGYLAFCYIEKDSLPIKDPSGSGADDEPDFVPPKF